MSDVASVVDSDVLPLMGRFTPLNPQGSQVSHLSSVQLSPNRVSFVCDVSKIRRGSAPSVADFVTGVAFVACITGYGLSAG